MPSNTVHRICITRTATSCTYSDTDLAYGFSTNLTRSRFDPFSPLIQKLLDSSSLMIRLAAMLPYDRDGELETDRFLEKFEGNLSLKKPITKKYAPK
jgi:hypothetical protein